jgi:L,D-peptidoglycan transpeptidase YkuD (ErfK/YbiS/YcfS/YnhG family)
VTIAILDGNGWLNFNARRIRAAIGAAGLTDHKQEGDHATPCGLLPLRRVLYRADRIAPPHCAVPVEPLAGNDGWCDDPAHAEYNRMIRLPHPGRHEALWREDDLYNIIGVLGWNDAPVIKHQGSAIFLHVARSGYPPTEGCVALASPDLLSALASGLTAIQTG